ncbi:MAG: Sec-independent protein translocase subunit TatA [Gammaproteobacteria bacterium]
MGSFSIWHWIVVLVIVVLVFGTKRLGSLGTDLSAFVKNFRSGLKDGEEGEEGRAPPVTDQRTSSPDPARKERDKTHG